MIILDYSQVALSNLLVQIGNHTNVEIDIDILRHMILNSIRLINSQFRREYGELVIACDDGKFWRKQIFPYYKAHRKRDRDASELDWNAIFEALAAVRDEIRNNFPYKVIQVETAEADDIIAALVMKLWEVEDKILIVSGDKDFQQLQKYPNVKQYDPTRKRFIKCANPSLFLYEHIMRGDAGDGIPNIRSADDSIMTRTRQKPITKQMVEDAFWNSGSTLLDQERINFSRNEKLISFDKIPEDIVNKVMDKYSTMEVKTRASLPTYFIKTKLRNLFEHLQDF